MNRRSFIRTTGLLGAGIYTATPQAAPAQAQQYAVPSTNRGYSLNGNWQQRIGRDLLRSVPVPSSLRPSGVYTLERTFTPPPGHPGQRLLLHFEGITLLGRAFCNGVELGEVLPFVPVTFDLTDLLVDGPNLLSTEIADLLPGNLPRGEAAITLGFHRGWETYGGVIRDVWLESRPACYIRNARLSYTFSPQFQTAECTVRVWMAGAITGDENLSVSLERAGRRVSGAQSRVQGQDEVELTFHVPAPALWSPASPQLYDLLATLQGPGGVDIFRIQTGFREFITEGPDFLLNGRRVVLNSSCRHDMWQDLGFTQEREQMRADLLAMKAMGANHVRLVHYPHHRHVVELADQLGLMVSEEPGYWQVDFNTASRTLVELGLDVLEGVIRRDWNSPSVVQWFLSNECRLTEDFLREGKARCRALDPLKRPVAAANDKRKEITKPLFDGAEMDFYTQHPYTVNIASFPEMAAFYGPGKPLMFTEWGGKEIGQSPHVMPNTVDMLLRMQNAHQLAGTSFWSWQDIPEFSRIDPEMQNGILESGIVTEARLPRERVAAEIRRLFRGIPPADPTSQLEVLPLRNAPWAPGASLQPVNLDALAEKQEHGGVWAQIESIGNTHRTLEMWPHQRIVVGGAEFISASHNGFARPLVVTPGQPELTIPLPRPAARVHVLGHVTWPGGYPVETEEDVPAVTLHLRFGLKILHSMPLRHGHEIARASCLAGSSRINPIALEAIPCLRHTRVPEHEQDQYLLYTVDVRNGQADSLTYQLHAEASFPLILLALSIEV